MKGLKFYLLGLFIFLSIYSLPSLYDDWRVNFRYQETQCTILDKNIVLARNLYRPGTQILYKPLVRVKYQANQNTYTCLAPASRLFPYTNTRTFAEELLDRYQINTVVSCWFNPNHPDPWFDATRHPYSVVLEKHLHATKALSLFISFLLLILIFGIESLNRSKATRATDKSGRREGSFLIKENLFSYEYIYDGDKPLTSDLLPEKFQKRSARLKEYVINTIHKNGKFITIKPALSIVIISLLFVIIFIFIITAMINLTH